MNAANAEQTNSRLRTLLLRLSTLIFIGTPIELILSEHYKEVTQIVPFLLCAMGVVVLVMAQRNPDRRTLTFLRWVMLIIAIGSLIGVGFHLHGNYEFEADIRPNATLVDLLIPTLTGAAPLMAPGVLVIAGVIAGIATYQHPALEASTVSPEVERSNLRQTS